MDAGWRPAQAYVPGHTPRHPEGLFDPLKRVGVPLEASLAWRAGLGLFRDGFYWEAHEVWEAVWLAAPLNGPERCLLRAVIQLANARLKLRMGRQAAARRLLKMAGADGREAFLRSGATSVLGMTKVQYNALFKSIEVESTVDDDDKPDSWP